MREGVSRGHGFAVSQFGRPFCRFRNVIGPITQLDMQKAGLNLYFDLGFTYSWFPRI
jgi:hypothetical protein